MNESEKPLEGTSQPEDQEPTGPTADEQPAAEIVEGTSSPLGDAASDLDNMVESASSAAARAADEAEGAVDDPTTGTGVAGTAVETPGGAGTAVVATSPTIGDRLARDREDDPDATQDDRVLAAVSYVSQLFFPLGLIVPVILLISETSKKRPYQKYHAVQSLALGIVIWVLQGALGVVLGAAGLSVVGLLCGCFIVPAMILLWLLPLYYAVQAYGGRRFSIPGMTQFLSDQGWL